MKDGPVYVKNAEYAREHDELPLFRASNQANIACKKALEKAITGNYSNNRLDVKTAFAEVAEQFGVERMKYVLAATIIHKDWDGRISNDNKAWAKTVPVIRDRDSLGGDRSVSFVVDQAHPGLVDLFATFARKEFAQEEKTSVLDKLKTAADLKQPSPSKRGDMEL